MDNRDLLTQRHFNGRVDFEAPDIYTLGQRLIDAGFAAELTGAPDGSRIVMTVGGSGVGFEIHNSRMFARKAEVRIQSYNTGGFILVAKERLELRPMFQKQGLGLRMFARQAFAAREAGVSQIWLTALRGRGYNGYYSWARYGFDAVLDLSQTQSFPPAFQAVRTLSELMSAAEGREVWSTCGATMQMCFELTDESCFEVLGKYMLLKGVSL